MAEGQKYFRMGEFSPSPNHRLLAYSVDFTGDEAYTIHVKDLETGELLADEIRNTYYSLEWANDNATFFYTVLDEAKRPYKVFRHTLGVAENDAGLSRGGRTLCGRVSKNLQPGVHPDPDRSSLTVGDAISATRTPRGNFAWCCRACRGVEYDLTHHGESFFIRTNDGGENVSRGGGAGDRSVEGELEGNSSGARGRDHRERDCVRRSSGGRGARPRPGQDPHPAIRAARRTSSISRSRCIQRRARRQRRVRHPAAAVSPIPRW